MHGQTKRHVVWGACALVGVLGALGSTLNPPTPGQVSVLGARTGTVVDIHGRSDIATLPPACQDPNFPGPVDAWWLGISPTVRVVAPVTGYRSWASANPAACANASRTEVYRGFYEFDIGDWVGQSGRIVSARLDATVRGTSVTPTFIPEPPAVPVEAYKCDGATAAAFQLQRLPPAVRFNNAFDTVVDSPATPARIPAGFPAGARVQDWPTKDPTHAPTGSSVREIRADFTRELIAALQAYENLQPPLPRPVPRGAARLVFVMAGTNEPPALKSAPLPFGDCRAAIELKLSIGTP